MKIKKKYRFKMAAKTKQTKQICVSRKWSRDQSLKNRFLKEFFNKIWLEEGKHKYLYIAKI